MTERIYEKDGALLKPKEEIIRCKDCRFAKAIPEAKRTIKCRRLLTPIMWQKDDFCPYGKRREGEE